MKPSLIFFVALLFAAVGLGVWWNSQQTSYPDEDLGLSQSEEVSEDTPTQMNENSSSLAELTESEEGEKPERAVVEVQPEAKAKSVDLSEDPTDPEAIWIEGRVEFAKDTPADEEIRVKARGKAFAGSKSNRRYHVVKVKGDGSFRVAVAAETRTASLKVLGRYSYLEEAYIYKTAEPQEVVLEPILGSLLEVEFQTPGLGLEPIAGFKATASGSGGREQIDLLKDSRKLEIPAVAMGRYGVRLNVTTDQYATVQRWLSGGEPGARKSLVIDLELASSIYGTVKDEAGEKINSGQIIVDLLEDSGMTYYVGPRADGAPIEAGAYKEGGLSSGSYTVKFSGKGYLSEQLEVKGIEPGENRKFDVVLKRGKTIHGTVHWRNGEPAVNAEVNLLLPENKAKFDNDGQDQLTRVDAEGNFMLAGFSEAASFGLSISALPPDLEVPEDLSKIKLRRWKRDNTVQVRKESVLAGGPAITVEIGAQGGALSGQVVDDLGKPIPKFRVTAVPRVGNSTQVAASGGKRDKFKDPDGKFSLLGLAPGSWGVHATALGHLDSEMVWVTIPSTKALQLEVPRASSLSGKVVNTDGEGVKAEVLRYELKDDGTLKQRWNYEDVTSSAKSGFVHRGLKPGGWRLIAQLENGATSQSLDIQLGRGESKSDIELIIPSSGEVQGFVHADWRSSPLYVTLRWKGDHSRYTPRPNPIAVGSAGVFTFKDVPAGSYSVEVLRGEVPKGSSITNYGFRGEHQVSSAASTSLGLTQQVEVLSGQVAKVHFDGRGAESVDLKGTLTEMQKPLPGWKLEVRARKGGGVKYAAQVADDGSYELVLPEPGEYTVYFQDGKGRRRGNYDSFEIDSPGAHTKNFDLPGLRLTLAFNLPDGKTFTQSPYYGSFTLRPLESRVEGLGKGQLKAHKSDTEKVYFSNVAAGEYSFHSSALRRGSESYVVLGPKTIEVTGDTVDQEVMLQLGPAAKLQGTVTGIPAGESDVTVMAFRDEAGNDYIEGVGVQDGQFLMSSLPPGEVWISTFYRSEKEAKRTRVVVTGGSTTTCQLAFQK